MMAIIRNIDIGYAHSARKEIYMRSESHSEVITLEVGGYTGTAEVAWITGSIYSIAHYGAFISVPFQNSEWVRLFVYDKCDLDVAMDKARDYLECALQRCTLC